MCHVVKQRAQLLNKTQHWFLFEEKQQQETTNLTWAMSGLNASLGYFVGLVIFAASVRTLLKKWTQLSFVLEFASSFMLVGCWLEVQTIVEVGQWAGGLGPDVTVTILFVVLLTHGVVCGGASGNPNLVVLKFLQLEASILPTLLSVVSQFLGAHVAILIAAHYWSLELTDMHMIKNLMASSCSTSLLVSLLQGFFTECVCACIFHLVHLNLLRRSALIRVPLIAVFLTFLSHTGKFELNQSSSRKQHFEIAFYNKTSNSSIKENESRKNGQTKKFK